MTKKTLYFLCTGNSYRSQMAEGLTKKHLSHDWEVRSAGIEAHGLNPRAVKAKMKVGIDIFNQSQKKIDQDYLNQATLPVTLCEDTKNRCHIKPPRVNLKYWGFDDLIKAVGARAKVWNGKYFNASAMKLANKLSDLKRTVIIK